MSSSSRMRGSSSTTRTRALGMTHRQAKDELGPEAVLASHRDLAAVLVDDPLDEREPEPGGIVARRRERLEDVGELVGANAVAGIREADLARAVDGRARNPQLASRRHGGHRVEAEVPEHLPEALAVGFQGKRG